MNAAMVIKEFGDHFGDLDMAPLAGHLKDGMKDISKNDLSSCEAMLYSQTQALQKIFVSRGASGDGFACIPART